MKFSLDISVLKRTDFTAEQAVLAHMIGQWRYIKITLFVYTDLK